MSNRKIPEYLRIVMMMILPLLALACSVATAPAGNVPSTSSGASGSETGSSGSSNTGAIGQRTKTSGCVSHNALPDSACTPGAILSDVTKDQICVPGYSSKTRNVPESEKNQVYDEYGIKSHTAGEYEVDHLISLELGGSNDIANLWPEPAEPRPGFHEKDKVENYLHQQVCNGAMTLQEAQYQIAHNWMAVYQKTQ